MKKLLLGLGLACWITGAFGQTVTQSGSVTAGQPARWITSGVIGSGGPATAGLFTGVGTTSNTAPGYCASSAASTAPRQQLCLWANTTNGAAITASNVGGATAAPLKFQINGIDSLYIAADGSLLGSPTVTGGAKGVGTLNVSALYVNGVSGAGGSVTGVQIVAGTGIAATGTCNITVSGTCTVGLAAIASNTVWGNVTGGSAVPTQLTKTQLTTLINSFTASLTGAVPAPVTAVGAFLRDDGTWTAPSGSGAVNAGTAGQLAYYATSTAAVSGNANLTIATSALTLGASGSAGNFLLYNGNSTNKLTLAPTSSGSARTLTLPDATDTLVGKATTDTLTNKTYDTAGTGNAFAINGTSITAVSGTGTTVAMSASPTFTTPTLGAATATSINKMAITAPASSSTLAVADGKTFTVSNTLTLTGTDSTSFAFPATSDTVGVLGVAQTYTAAKTFSANLITTSAAILVIGGGIRVPVDVQTAGYSVLSSDYVICVKPSAAVAITLPGSPTAGDTYLVKDCNGTAGTNNITVNGNGNNIDGASTYVMNSNRQSAAFTYSGDSVAKWMVN